MQWTAPYELRKLTVSWTREPLVGVSQDVDQCTFHFLNLTDGDPDDSWTEGDFGVVEDAFDTYWEDLKTTFAPTTALHMYSWRKDGPAYKPHGTELSPLVREVPRASPGTEGLGTQQLPPQCAISVTEVTPATFVVHGVGVPGHAEGTGRTQTRNRWGRFYLPAPDIGSITQGRFTEAFAENVSLKTQSFYNACVAGDIIPVVYSPTTGDTWNITEVHVDDIVDVQRSRRYVTPLSRSAMSIDAP